jgi:hypothetical protein
VIVTLIVGGAMCVTHEAPSAAEANRAAA